MAKEKASKSKVLIISVYVMVCILFVICLYSFGRFYLEKKPHYVKLNENSELDYKVCLKSNDFFETKCLEKGNQYVASLIDYIPVNFAYKLKFMDKKMNFKYSYKIDAKFDVVDKNNRRTFFTKRETLYESDIIDASDYANIDYDIDIDYNKYNDILNSFITLYDLDETINTLNVSMNVNILSDGNTVMDEINKNSVISLSIPLTRKTVNIDMVGNTNGNSNIDVLVKNKTDYKLLLIVGITSLVGLISLIIYLVCYYLENRTVLEIYQKRIKKILGMYDSYIQRITGNYPIGASQICKVASFRDMLEIKDSSDKPLLMLENEEKTGTFFIIPVGEGVIYTYALRVEDIMAEKAGEKAPDYNIEDIGNTNEEPKKYTKEKIKEDIEKTTKLSIINDDNAIKGTENTDESLYDQLEKTASFKAIKDNYYFPEKKKTKKASSKKKKTAKKSK